MKAVAKNGIALILVDLEIEFLEELIFPLYELLFADAEQDCDLGCQSPKLFVLDHSGGMRVVFLPKI